MFADFWTLVWAIVVGLIIFGIIVWIIGALVNSAMGNPLGNLGGTSCGQPVHLDSVTPPPSGGTQYTSTVGRRY